MQKMSEKEALQDIQFLARRYNDLDQLNYSVKQESLDMAIEAIEKQSMVNEILHECTELKRELDAYKEQEKQGLLLRLPCKVGDTVYKLWYKPCHLGNDMPDSWGCCGCEDECDLKKEIFEFTVPSLDWILQHMKYFGDCVWFLTKAEAESALEKMKGE